MTVYTRIVYPALARFDAESTHDRTLSLLELAQRRRIGCYLLSKIAGDIPDRPVHLFGLRFPNRLGVAAGFDKDARVVPGLAALGFGHIEVGTITPYPQAGNPRPRVFRLAEDGALVNRMGFPNAGVAALLPRLRALSGRDRSYVLGVSLGKQKETPLTAAAEDYVTVMRAVFPFADYLVVNVSSPNTPGLRKLQGRAFLESILKALQHENEQHAAEQNLPRRPILLKIAPDLALRDVEATLDVALTHGAAGLIATNTTVARDNLNSPLQSESGGLSGTPLQSRSDTLIAFCHRCTDGKLPIVGVGGVRTPDDFQRKLDAGAALVQLYTGLVYEGPGLAGHLLRHLQ